MKPEEDKDKDKDCVICNVERKGWCKPEFTARVWRCPPALLPRANALMIERRRPSPPPRGARSQPATALAA